MGGEFLACQNVAFRVETPCRTNFLRVGEGCDLARPTDFCALIRFEPVGCMLVIRSSGV